MKKLLISLAAPLLAGTVLAQAALPQVNAEVRKVDTATQRITLKHGDIPNIDMGAMTMVFRVKEPALLAKVKAGDLVTFTADKIDGNLTVMSIDHATP